MAQILNFEADLAERVKDAVLSPGHDRLAEISVFSDIRGYYRGLSDANQLPTALAAVKAGDKRTVTALLSAPAYLAGLTDQQLEVIRDAVGAHFAPLEFKQLQATRKIAEKVRAGGGYFLRHQDRIKTRTVENEAPKVRARRAVENLKMIH